MSNLSNFVGLGIARYAEPQVVDFADDYTPTTIADSEAWEKAKEIKRLRKLEDERLEEEKIKYLSTLPEEPLTFVRKSPESWENCPGYLRGHLATPGKSLKDQDLSWYGAVESVPVKREKVLSYCITCGKGYMTQGGKKAKDLARICCKERQQILVMHNPHMDKTISCVFIPGTYKIQEEKERILDVYGNIVYRCVWYIDLPHKTKPCGIRREPIWTKYQIAFEKRC